MATSRVKRFFVNNRGLKLVSLLIAVVLWVRVVGSEGSEGHFNVSLVLTNVPKGLVLVGTIPESLSVRLAGPRAIMSALDDRTLSFTLDLTGMQEGATSYELLPSKLKLPRGVEVTQLSPSKLLLQADKKVKKKVPATPRLSGVPAQGFVVASTVIEPREVEVEGAERYIKPLKEVHTEIVDVSGISDNYDRDAEVAIADPGIKPTGRKSFHVEVGVREVNIEKGFTGVPVVVPSPRWVAKPQTIEVRLSGSVAGLSGITARDIEARAVPKGQVVSRGPVPLAIMVPEGTRFVTANPAEVILLPATK